MELFANPDFAASPNRYGLLMSDLRGFTALTEQYPVDKLAPLLNMYYHRMTDLIDRHGGTVDKFMGDSIFALFPAEDDGSASLPMLECAVDMQLAMDEINHYSSSLSLPHIYMGIGLNVGDVLTWTLGSGLYRDQAVLGDPVNLASRMSAFALRGQVLISPALLDAVGHSIECGTTFSVMLKGKKHPVTVHELLGLLHPVPKLIPVRENRKGPRVEVLLPISYHLIEDKQVRQKTVKADIIDLSYGGMRIVTPQAHELLDEVKIALPFGIGSGDIYAKVLYSTPEPEGGYCISTEFSYIDEATRKSVRSLVDHLA